MFWKKLGNGKRRQKMTFEESCRETAQEVAELIIQKHRDYGPDNILSLIHI